MPSKQQLETALRNADAAGDVEAATFIANAIRSGQYEESPAQLVSSPKQETGVLETIDKAIQNNPIGATIAEGAAAINRGATQVADFLTTTPVNAALELAGSDARLPTITETLSPATGGNFMEAGVPRDIVRAAGEAIPGGVAAGSVLRGAAGALGPAMLSSGEGVTAGAIRQLGTSTLGQDAGFSALSGAGSAVGQDIGGDTGSAIGAVLAPVAPVAAAAAGGAALKRIFGGDGATRVIDDFAAFGEVPTVGQASGKKGLQSAENISGNAIGGSPLAKKSDQIATSIQNRLAKIADKISTEEGAEAAGLAIQKGISGPNGYLDRFRNQSTVLWQDLHKYISPKAPAALANTKSALKDLVRGGEIGEVLDNPKLSQLKSVLDSSPDVDFETLQDIRSAIGLKIASNDLLPEIPRAELKRVYGALTQDIKNVAQQNSPDALTAFNKANTYTNEGHELYDDYLRKIATNVNPDQIFRAIARGGEGTTAINKIKSSVKPWEWQVVAANVVRRMGRASSGHQNAVGDDALGDAFSVEKFVSDWDKLGPARKAIFSGSQKIDNYGEDLAKIARAASVIKNAKQQSRNASGTAQALAKTAAGTGLATGAILASPTILGLTAGSIAMNNAGARLMSNPAFVKWLAQSAKIPASRSSAAIGGLVGVANQSSADDAALIQSLAEELENNND